MMPRTGSQRDRRLTPAEWPDTRPLGRSLALPELQQGPARRYRWKSVCFGAPPRKASCPLSLKIRRIDCTRDDALAAIAGLRRELSPKGNVVSAEGKARTVAAFGEPLTPGQVVEKICADVASRGMTAVLDYTRRLDGVSLEPSAVRVSERELEDAHGKADPAYLKTLASVRENILAYQQAILNRDVRVAGAP